ncbi:MAG: hypothetical protein HKN23_15050 [Verrucomicrobiales bacterium]|nr:hypothetical protein [Verrucomicrobiales bacterium]
MGETEKTEQAEISEAPKTRQSSEDHTCDFERKLPDPEKEGVSKYADEVRQLICHEGNLMNHRFQWFALLTGLLFASFGLLWEFRASTHNILVIVSILGILVSGSSWAAAYLGDRACVRLENSYARMLLPDFCPECIQDQIPPVIGLTETKIWKHVLPWRILFPIFILAWIGILLILLSTPLPLSTSLPDPAP